MAPKPKSRQAPQIDHDILTEDFAAQLDSGAVHDALAADTTLPPFVSPRGQSARLDRCLWRNVTLTAPNARGLRLYDTQIEGSDLANLDLTGGHLERVEITGTRLTGATFTEAQLKSVLFRECKLDLAFFRMARLQHCVFERCNLTDADLYNADLTGTIFKDCDLSRAELSHAKLIQADVRDCRLDGLRGTPADMAGLMISPDQAPQLITLFGVKVKW
ncbi:pentapeptide repeat-containing protein [Granulicella tundricola]|uniref:Pentapeptide repeat protein n=1 Tax=Granulicella tundricola (strain ATCC BAA-1859 / DSM 23138 / MP5ACTX9) TaxID=1198114 RepID=E8X476_GRATM|nr:pentapeptide repeat-containing protein [Granulicella tundricola]ADW67136.1 pentapeptide repeat protein [Granulicella tundricola MP5ACTX9]